jgi:hypothetical protein
MRFFSAAAAATVLTVFSATPALAGVTTYSTRTAWEAASTGTTNEAFEGFAPDQDAAGPYYDPATAGTLTLDTDDSGPGGTSRRFFFVGAGFYYPTGTVSSQNNGQGNSLTVTLPGAYTALAVDLGTDFTTTFTITLFSGSQTLQVLTVSVTKDIFTDAGPSASPRRTRSRPCGSTPRTGRRSTSTM